MRHQSATLVNGFLNYMYRMNVSAFHSSVHSPLYPHNPVHQSLLKFQLSQSAASPTSVH